MNRNLRVMGVLIIVSMMFCLKIANASYLVKEVIVFLQEDGVSTIKYDGARSNSRGYSFWAKKDGLTLEEYFRDYLYFFPNDYKWDTSSDKEYNVLRINQGDSSCLITGTIKQNIKYDSSGVYTFNSWDGSKMPDGHFGFWNAPNDYNEFVYVWVVPANIEVIDYESNKAGEWIRRQNTIAYFGKNINDLTFLIRFRFKSKKLSESLQKSLDKNEAVEIDENKVGLRISMAAEILFPSGTSALSEEGEKILLKIVDEIKGEKVNIAINGHTDNQPIRGKLKSRYKSNWELSAFRALTVLHYLAKKGLPSDRLEARAFGEFHPKVSNDNPINRAKNRRIELIISTNNSN